MELAIAGSIAGTAKVVEPCQHRQQAVQIFETAQITLGEIGLLGCHRSPPANMTVTSCAESNAQKSCRTGVGTFRGIHFFQAHPKPGGVSPRWEFQMWTVTRVAPPGLGLGVPLTPASRPGLHSLAPPGLRG